MRLRLGAAMPEKGGRTAVVGAEVRVARGRRGEEFHYLIGLVDRVQPPSVSAARDRVRGFLEASVGERPCVVVDVATPQGLALHQELKPVVPAELHRPHAALGATRALTFSKFLQALAGGTVHFAPNLDYRQDLDRALVFYMGGGVAKHGVELSSEDEALVVAVGLALLWPRHGGIALPWDEV